MQYCMDARLLLQINESAVIKNERITKHTIVNKLYESIQPHNFVIFMKILSKDHAWMVYVAIIYIFIY